jgi:capsule polysaccharide modification protein KpsS
VLSISDVEAAVSWVVASESLRASLPAWVLLKGGLTVTLPKTPTQHALFLQHTATMQQENLNNNIPKSFPPRTADTQFEFDIFYSTAHSLLSQFYPERTTTFTSRDQQYITPEIKAKLRRKNRLMRAGRAEEAGALAERIGKDLERQSKNRLKTINGKTHVKDVGSTAATDGSKKRHWTCFRDLHLVAEQPQRRHIY